MKRLLFFSLISILLLSSCGTFSTLGMNCGVTLSESGCKHEPHSCDLPPKLKVQKAFGEKSTLWTDRNVLKVYFLDGTSHQRDLVRKYMVEWNGLGNIKIQEANKKSESDIRVSFKYDGSWSYVGTDNKFIGKSDPTMNYGWLREKPADYSKKSIFKIFRKAKARSNIADGPEAKRVVLHEFGHAIGLQHEHQHPKAGIKWDSVAVYDYYAQMGWSKQDVDQQLFTRFSEDQTNFTKYDRKSIMHYPVPSTLTLDGYSVDWNTNLSANDKKWVQTYYPYTCKIIKP